MSNSILANALSRPTLSIVRAIGGEDVAKGIGAQKVSIRLTSRTFRHMREDGVSIVDARIIEPASITMDVFCRSLDQINNLHMVAADRNSYYTITTKGLIFDLMMAEESAQRQTPDVLSAAPIRLNFREILVQGTKSAICAQPPDSNLIDRGLQLIDEQTGGAVEQAKGLVADLLANLTQTFTVTLREARV